MKIKKETEKSLKKEYYELRRKEFFLNVKRFLKIKSAAAGGIIFLIILFSAIFAPILTSFSPFDFIDEPLLGISSKYIFGLDDFGRDVFTRILYGARISITIGIGSQIFAAFIGIFVGVLSGYYGKWIDIVLMRITDVFLAFPFFLLAIILMVVLGPNLFNIIFTLGITMWPRIARVVRSQTLVIREQTYIEVAKSIGCNDSRIIFKHILPNCISSVLVLITLGTASSILAESGLSFLGLGIQPPTPSWGIMIAASKSYLRSYPFLVVIPGIVIMVTVFSINLFGDGLRDILDPRLKI
jgi:ABC-type dipeptide/oligopeptide/nickel transport system permease subunit